MSVFASAKSMWADSASSCARLTEPSRNAFSKLTGTFSGSASTSVFTTRAFSARIFSVDTALSAMRGYVDAMRRRMNSSDGGGKSVLLNSAISFSPKRAQNAREEAIPRR